MRCRTAGNQACVYAGVECGEAASVFYGETEEVKIGEVFRTRE